jgi:hypothetical protein
LIKASFVPDEAIHDLRTLMRARKQLVREQPAMSSVSRRL